MLSATMLAQMDTGHFISVARMHAATIIELEALDRLETLYRWPDLVPQLRELIDRVEHLASTLDDLSVEANDIAYITGKLCNFNKD